MNKIKILSLILAVFFASTCALPGPVYVMIAWFETDGRPSVFNHNIIGVPAIASVANGQYYKSDAGTFSIIDVSYFAPASGPWVLLNFALRANGTVLGNEPAFYDIRLSRTGNPTITKVPK